MFVAATVPWDPKKGPNPLVEAARELSIDGRPAAGGEAPEAMEMSETPAQVGVVPGRTAPAPPLDDPEQVKPGVPGEAAAKLAAKTAPGSLEAAMSMLGRGFMPPPEQQQPEAPAPG